MVCPTCGAPVAREQFGPCHWVTDTNAPGIKALFSRELDEARCAVCNAGLGEDASLVFLLTDPLELLFAPGDQLRAQSEEWAPLLRAEWGKQGVTHVTELPSADELRLAVWQRMDRFTPRLAAAQRANADGQFNDFMRTRWREFPPEAFLSGLFTISAKYHLYAIPQSQVEEVKSLGQWQAASWLWLCAEWAESPPPDGSFEDDLARYLAPAALVQGAPEAFFARADRMRQELSPERPFCLCLEAVRATLYSFLKQPNPRGAEWAQMLVGFELQLSELTEDPARLRRLQIGAERARHTAEYQHVFDALRPILQRRHLERWDAAQALVERLGFPNLLADLRQAVRVTVGADAELPPPAQLLAEMLAANPPQAPADQIPAALGALEATRLTYSSRLSAAQAEELAEAALSSLPATAEARAEINAWLGQALKDLREPHRFLRRIGSAITPEEETLPRSTQLKLWTERGTALRLTTRWAEARAVYERVAALYGGRLDTRDARTARANLARAYRETGAPDAALRMVEELLPYAEGKEQVDLLENLAATYNALGDSRAVLACYERALALATGPFAEARARFVRGRVALLVGHGDTQAALAELLALPLPTAAQEDDLLHEAAAWLNALARRAQLTPEMQERVINLTEALEELNERTAARGDVQVRLWTLAALARLHDHYDLPEAWDYWKEINEVAQQAGRGLNAEALLGMARVLYRNGEAEGGRVFLGLALNALAELVGQARRLELVVNSLNILDPLFKRLVSEIATQVERGRVSVADLRLVAELQREAVRRTMRADKVERGDFFNPTDEQLASLAPARGAVGVIEWVDAGDYMAMLLTRIERDGRIEARFLPWPKLDLDALRKTMLTKLNRWHRARGDPFALPAWQEFETWLAATLAPHLPEESHLVIIEHESLPGLPWHVAAAPHWSCSYAASWNSLLQLPDRADSADPDDRTALGVALAPAYDEEEEVVNALRASARRTADFAAATRLSLRTAYEQECDHERLRALLESCRVLKLLCHGFVYEHEHEVAWMIAANQALPFKLPQIAATPAARAHRYSWKQLQELERAPQVLFSAACSSARAHLAGLGERLGLFPPLRERGASALVAPGWDIEPAAVLEILDETLEVYLQSGAGLAVALRAACRRAEATTPRWLAWALTIEGDWR
jgi:tetratricopeptide (TPR) repeat protein